MALDSHLGFLTNRRPFTAYNRAQFDTAGQCLLLITKMLPA